jgi:hypothetical protein
MGDDQLARIPSLTCGNQWFQSARVASRTRVSNATVVPIRASVVPLPTGSLRTNADPPRPTHLDGVIATKNGAGQATLAEAHVTCWPTHSPPTHLSSTVSGRESLHAVPSGCQPQDTGTQHVAWLQVLYVVHAVLSWRCVPGGQATLAAPHEVDVPSNATCGRSYQNTLKMSTHDSAPLKL